jgi:hypothetical protein
MKVDINFIRKYTQIKNIDLFEKLKRKENGKQDEGLEYKGSGLARLRLRREGI